ncbi:hypothetical protein F4777DRAFT_562810 [Nemania sp. FL0916]|nr:hypothetical protein F4777DRAFT_562810 [Nemania sp. FL0916]
MMLAKTSSSDGGWTLDTLRQSLEASQLASSLHTAGNPEFPLDDPEKRKYILELTRYILTGRTLTVLYNIVLLVVLLIISLFHLYRNLSEKRKWIAIERDSVREGSDISAGSSSSSTLEGSLSSRANSIKDDDNTDVERQPLLSPRPIRLPSDRSKPGVLSIIRSWLMYQPGSIPIINRALPSNGTSIFILGYVGLNIFCHLFRVSFEPQYLFALADRAGSVFIANLPLLYLLAAKNQPLRLLTGRSYEALNIYHRRVGELMCFEAFVHFVGMVVWRIWLRPDWLATESLWAYFAHPLILLGIGTFVSYELLYFTSLRSFRQRWYELFLASHVLLQIAALVFLWLHFPTSRPYVAASLAIFVVDRVVWRMGLKSATVNASVTVLEDGETVRLSANWDMSQLKEYRSFSRYFRRRNILYGWRPADHVFISIPELGRSHALQAHPFTIASAAPSLGDVSPTTPHAQLDLLIRGYSGFTSALLQHAQEDSALSARIDGPYGSQAPLNRLRASALTILIAGGSGIAVIFPLVWDLAIVHPGKRSVHLLWIIHSRSQLSWIPAHMLDQLRRAGVCIVVPEPTVEVGRPDVARYVESIVSGSRDSVGVVVSGPDGLNRTVRNACAKEVCSGAVVSLMVEKFGW